MKYYFRNLPRYIFQWTWNLLDIFQVLISFSDSKSWSPCCFVLPLVYSRNHLFSALGAWGLLEWNESFILQLYVLTDFLKVDLHIKRVFFKCSAMPSVLHLLCWSGSAKKPIHLYYWCIKGLREINQLHSRMEPSFQRKCGSLIKANFPHFKIL